MELALGIRCPVCGNFARSMRKPLLERFWEKVDKKGENECWPWTAYCGRGGYGTIRQGGRDSRRLRAHRVSWVFYHGKPIPDGMIIMHICDHPWCVNPQHLKLGTDADNVRDMHQKGRNRPRRSMQSPDHSKIYTNPSPYTEEQIHKVLYLAKSGLAQRKIAASLNMSRRTIRDVLSGKRWGWLTGIEEEK